MQKVFGVILIGILGAGIFTYSHEKSTTINLIAVGDVMLGRGVKADKAFSKVHDFLMDSDGVFINFEGAIWTDGEVPKDDPGVFPPQLFFAPNVTNILKENNVEFASVANNHGLDAGADGLRKTRELLSGNGVSPIGDPTETSASFVVQKEIRGIATTWIAFNMIRNSIDAEEAAKLVKTYAANEHPVVIVSVHWGLEYSLTQNENQVRFARLLVDNGADIILGSHPHVVQPIEEYKGKPIFYSLGNFVFDQTPVDTRKSIAVKFHISNSSAGDAPKVTYDVVPINIVNNAPEPVGR